MSTVSKPSTSPATTSTPRTTTSEPTTTTKPTATPTPTAVPCPPTARQPDLDQKADSARLLGTTPKTAAPAVPAAADAALKSQLDAARATGNPNPNKPTSTEWKQPFPTKTKYEIGPDFEGVKAGGSLGKGNSGPGVEDLQGKLNTALKGTGANSLDTDGLFGPKTEANLKTYQESRGLPVTGKLDAATASALESNKAAAAGWSPAKSATMAAANASTPTSTGGTTDTSNVVSASTAGMSEQQKFDHYKGLIERSGGRFNPNGPNIVGVRTPTNGSVNGGGGRYDDTFAVITMKNGRPSVQEFRGNTEPAGNYRGRMGQDVNGDGRLDQGQLRPGHYTYSSSSYRGGPALRMRGDSVVDRDTNRDGVFGNDGGASSRGGASMLFHRGGNNTTGSAGCQTMPPAEFDRFMGALRNAGMGPGGSVGYTLVNAG